MKRRLANAIIWSVAVLEILFYTGLRLPQFLPLLNAGVQFIAVFLAFFLSYWLATEQERKQVELTHKKEEKRSLRTEKFALGLLWHELRANKNLLLQIKNNFKFLVDEKHLKFAASKMELLKSLAEKIEDRSYKAIQSSGAITELKTDEVYNDLAIAYENCGFLQTNLLIATHDFGLKYELFNDPDLSKEMTQEIKTNLLQLAREKIPQTEKEINAADLTVDTAIRTVDARLNTLGVKSELIRRPLD